MHVVMHVCYQVTCLLAICLLLPTLSAGTRTHVCVVCMCVWHCHQIMNTCSTTQHAPCCRIDNPHDAFEQLWVVPDLTLDSAILQGAVGIRSLNCLRWVPRWVLRLFFCTSASTSLPGALGPWMCSHVASPAQQTCGRKHSLTRL